MNFFEYLRPVDVKILEFANGYLAHPWNDFVFKLWTAEAPWFVLATFFFVQSAYRRQWDHFKALLWLSATVGVSDAFAAQVLKPLVGRIRPCKVEEWIRVVDGCAGSLSFPSNHAANGAAFAIFWFLWKGPRIGTLALLCMFFVGFSRLYLGVHYPSDVVGGFLVGASIGATSYALYRLIVLKKAQKKEAV